MGIPIIKYALFFVILLKIVIVYLFQKDKLYKDVVV